ncbi:TadE/TadG family type IV pilus assembly protein [Novosphingobium sp.]|uniref:TadE/TadG family type IV pilus assembly protein n=1 Tax=Novosphingobium sp. TaxID=1874826 RepID=UPI002735DAA8|nr:TadE/TadG family type IV pilus assembly protein [Novosphingobium sp.]MDP3907505.1 TadE/TadG family type IV pilus assembly protein [Novosphingobium sp.]
MAIETALIAPVIVLLSLGAFQISSMVARQSELQGAVAEAQAIALAVDPDTSEKRQTLREVIMASANLEADKVSVAAVYRCNDSAAYVTAVSECAANAKVTSYVKITITDEYEPIWTKFGIKNSIDFNIERYVLFKQATNPA